MDDDELIQKMEIQVAKKSPVKKKRKYKKKESGPELYVRLLKERIAQLDVND